MNKDQQKVVIGAASGAIVMVLMVWFLTHTIPSPDFADTISDRLAYALRANVFALIPLLIVLITVGNERFFSKAIDPTRHAEGTKMEINGRVADNTLQQNFVFAIATLALATIVPFMYLQVVWACAIVFVIARFAFWAGYQMHPLYRAPGMAPTAYMNLGTILYCLYHIL